MNFKRVQLNREMIKGKYVVGIDPAQNDHKAMILSPDGIPIKKPFGFKVSKKGFKAFENKVRTQLKNVHKNDITIAIESSCNLWQTFISYFKERGYVIVKISPLTTYLSRAQGENNFSKSDNRDSYLIAEAAHHGKYYNFYDRDNSYNELQQLNICYNKLSNNLTQAKLRLRGFMLLVFPEFLSLHDFDTATAMYLLQKYMTPKDFIEIKNPEEDGEALRKLSQSQHGVDSILKIQEIARESIGINIESMYDTMRLILTCYKETYEHFQRMLQLVGERMINLSYEFRSFHIITSLKGISEITASQLIAEIGDFSLYQHYRQIEKHAGLNLRISQSGKYANANHINKCANKRLAKAIYQATRHTARYIPEVKIKYLRRKIKKNIYKKNIVACTSVLLRLIFALVKADKNYKLCNDSYEQLVAIENKCGIESKKISFYEPRNKCRFFKKHFTKKKGTILCE